MKIVHRTTLIYFKNIKMTLIFLTKIFFFLKLKLIYQYHHPELFCDKIDESKLKLVK
jgi:hypothetical protein